MQKLRRGIRPALHVALPIILCAVLFTRPARGAGMAILTDPDGDCAQINIPDGEPVSVSEAEPVTEGNQVIEGVSLDGQRPVVASPHHIETSLLGTESEAAPAGEEVDRAAHAAPPNFFA